MSDSEEKIRSDLTKLQEAVQKLTRRVSELESRMLTDARGKALPGD